MGYNRRAFTLIEVMVAVMIVSVVIGAIINLRGNTSNLLMQIKKDEKSLQYASFLPWSKENGIDSARTNLYRLSEDVDIDDELRKKLKASPVKIEYKTVRSYEMENTTFEIGVTTLKSKDFEISLERIILQ